MITQDQIKVLANKYQTTELNCRREYFQHLFLTYFYQQPQANIIYFKGGTALKIIYQSPRFSEDLDFDTRLQSIKPIEEMILQTVDAIEKESIQTNIQEAKQTSGGYLSAINFKAFGSSVDILLQISLRAGNKGGEVNTIVNDFVPTYLVIQLKQEQLVDEKIKALLSRKKPRDFYDLYFILRSNLLPAEKKDILPQVLKALNSINYNFEAELKLFLPKSHWQIIKEFKHNLEQEINRFL